MERGRKRILDEPSHELPVPGFTDLLMAGLERQVNAGWGVGLACWSDDLKNILRQINYLRWHIKLIGSNRQCSPIAPCKENNFGCFLNWNSRYKRN